MGSLFSRLLVAVFCLVLAPISSQAAIVKIAVIEGFSGSFANAGEAVWRNLRFAVERSNNAGAAGAHQLELLRFDSKGQVDEALVMLRSAIDQGANVILQGNSSAVAAALIDAIDKHNQRAPEARVVFLNFSAVDPALTNERCSYWHFRFDAHADMRLAALTDALAQNKQIKKVYLINQDYSFGQRFAKTARQMVTAKRSDVQIVGEELIALGRTRDFSPHILRIKATGADTIMTGNWGNDLTLLVRAARELGLDANFYTFYGNGLGAPQAIGAAGVGRVRSVAEWHPNAGMDGAEKIYQAFKKSVVEPRDDYFNMRNVVMIDMLAEAVRQSGIAPNAAIIAKQLSGMEHRKAPYSVRMRAADHQLLTPLYVAVMDNADGNKVRFDLEGSGFGFRTERYVEAHETAQNHQCVMKGN